MKQQLLNFCQFFYAVFSMVVYGNLWLDSGNFLFRVLFTLMFIYSAYLLLAIVKKIRQRLEERNADRERKNAGRSGL